MATRRMRSAKGRPEPQHEEHPYGELWADAVASALAVAKGDDIKRELRELVKAAERGDPLTVSRAIRHVRAALSKSVTAERTESLLRGMVARQRRAPAPAASEEGKDAEEKLRTWRASTLRDAPAALTAWRLLACRLVEVFARELRQAGKSITVGGVQYASAQRALLRELEKAAEHNTDMANTVETQELLQLCAAEEDALRAASKKARKEARTKPVVAHEDSKYAALAELERAGWIADSITGLAERLDWSLSKASRVVRVMRAANLLCRPEKEHASGPVLATKKGKAWLAEERQRLRTV